MADDLAIGSQRLPEFFRPVLWSYNFEALSPAKDAQEIILNALNYGEWRHLKWAVDYYGKDTIKNIIESTAASEFRAPVLALCAALFNVKPRYASRGDKIKSSANL